MSTDGAEFTNEKELERIVDLYIAELTRAGRATGNLTTKDGRSFLREQIRIESRKHSNDSLLSLDDEAARAEARKWLEFAQQHRAFEPDRTKFGVVVFKRLIATLRELHDSEGKCYLKPFC